MTLARPHGGWVIVASFVVALLLSTLPLPDWILPWRPEWSALVLIYWTMALPHRVGVGVGWIVGLLLDVLQGTLLGQHALGLATLAFVTYNLHQRVRVFPLWQQALTVMLFLALYQLLLLWFDGITGRPPRGWEYWIPSLTGMALWPWIFVVLRDLRRRFKVT
ncbi:MAG TPA: rod shape-determining protein MreD [Thiotrichales bacterium]|nr:rod shape-determining protein MreD [Thiotrichales bacterium]